MENRYPDITQKEAEEILIKRGADVSDSETDEDGCCVGYWHENKQCALYDMAANELWIIE